MFSTACFPILAIYSHNHSVALWGLTLKLPGFQNVSVVDVGAESLLKQLVFRHFDPTN